MHRSATVNNNSLEYSPILFRLLFIPHAVFDALFGCIPECFCCNPFTTSQLDLQETFLPRQSNRYSSSRRGHIPGRWQLTDGVFTLCSTQAAVHNGETLPETRALHLHCRKYAIFTQKSFVLCFIFTTLVCTETAFAASEVVIYGRQS